MCARVRCVAQVVEDHEDALVAGLTKAGGKDNGVADVAKAVCGSRGMDVCGNRKGQWLGERSPFACTGRCLLAKPTPIPCSSTACGVDAAH